MGTELMVNAAQLSIEKRQSRLEALEAERDQLRKEIDGLELAVKVLKEDCDEDEWEEMCADDSLPSDPYSQLDTIEEDDIPITHRARNTAYRVLLATRPIHRSKLLELVEAEGTKIIGRNPADLLTSYLSPDARFKPAPNLRGFWTLTEEPTGKRPISPVGGGV